MYRECFIEGSKILVSFDTDTVHLGRDNKTRYRKCVLSAAWGTVQQVVREDRLVDEKGKKPFVSKEPAEAMQ